MSGLAPGSSFPSLDLRLAGGEALEWRSLRRRHLALLLLPQAGPAALALAAQAQARQDQLRWLELRWLSVFPGGGELPADWPAPAHPPCRLEDPLPPGLAWGRAYIVSKRGSLLASCAPEELDFEGLEKDLLYWEAGHCLP